ncbi:MAG: hypothetical protein NW216_09210 [Hyphomicrobium sp.]|nr:hypothetical protein [Hyphomicrobium sp.]
MTGSEQRLPVAGIGAWIDLLRGARCQLGHTTGRAVIVSGLILMGRIVVVVACAARHLVRANDGRLLERVLEMDLRRGERQGIAAAQRCDQDHCQNTRQRSTHEFRASVRGGRQASAGTADGLIANILNLCLDFMSSISMK